MHQGNKPDLALSSIGSTTSSSLRSDIPGATINSLMYMQYSGSNAISLGYTFALDSPTITTGINAPTTWTLTGTIAHGQDQPIGSYKDTIAAAVNF